MLIRQGIRFPGEELGVQTTGPPLVEQIKNAMGDEVAKVLLRSLAHEELHLVVFLGRSGGELVAKPGLLNKR